MKAREPGKAFASVVLPMPGTSSISKWPLRRGDKRELDGLGFAADDTLDLGLQSGDLIGRVEAYDTSSSGFTVSAVIQSLIRRAAGREQVHRHSLFYSIRNNRRTKKLHALNLRPKASKLLKLRTSISRETRRKGRQSGRKLLYSRRGIEIV
jgi:hypothetical protein